MVCYGDVYSVGITSWYYIYKCSVAGVKLNLLSYYVYHILVHAFAYTKFIHTVTGKIFFYHSTFTSQKSFLECLILVWNATFGLGRVFETEGQSGSDLSSVIKIEATLKFARIYQQPPEGIWIVILS